MELVYHAHNEIIWPTPGNRCDNCGHSEYALNPEGYAVCASCGMVCDDVPLTVREPPRPRRGSALTHAIPVPCGLLMGFRRERAATTAPDLRRILGYHHILGQDEIPLRAYFTIRRITCVMGLDPMPRLFDAALLLFRQFHAALPRRSYSCNIEVLSAVAVYRAAARVKVFLNRPEFLAKCLPDARARRIFATALSRTAPSCATLEEPDEILHLIRETSAVSKVPARASQAAYLLARRHGRWFRSPKPIIRAAAILAVTCAIEGLQISVNQIALQVGVAVSAVFRCIYNAGGKKGLVKDASWDWWGYQRQLKDMFPLD